MIGLHALLPAFRRPVSWADWLARLPALLLALALCGAPLLVAPTRPVAGIGLAGLALALVGIVTLWQWPVTGAACEFLTAYGVALWLADLPVSVVAAASVGLAVLFLLQAAELARCARATAVGAGVGRSLLLRVLSFGAAALIAALLATTGAGALAMALPFAAAPFAAAAGALGVVVALAVAIRRAAR
jgi:hypothetical protein